MKMNNVLISSFSRVVPRDRRVRGRIAPALAAVALAIATAGASPADEHRFEITPYLWGAGLDGTVRVNDRPASGLAVEQSFSDLLEILDVGIMGAFEARGDRWALLVDAMYLKVSNEGTVSGPLGFVSLTGDGKLTQQMYSVAAAYRVKEGPGTVDLIGGVRYNDLAWDVTIDLSVPAVSGGVRESQNWTDPYLGARLNHPFGKRWNLMGYGDVGGFGVGSDLSWQGVLGLHYRFKPTLIGKFGYRHLSNDYDDSGFRYDMATSGVFVGLGIGW